MTIQSLERINFTNNKNIEMLESLNDTDAEERFDDLVCELKKHNIDLAEEWEDKLMNEYSDDKITMQEACVKMFKIVQGRIKAEHKTTVDYSNENLNEVFIKDGQKITTELIELSEKLPDNFLGNGAVAEVYNLEKIKDTCVKIVKDFNMYKQGNTIHQEGRFLDLLKNLNVDGVRTPELFGTISTINLTAMIQEQLPAVNFRRVIEGHDEMPKTFDVDRYFEKLEKYMNAMHEAGIYHQDFVIRNMMIDNETGDPYVIDFGKAVNKDDIIGENFDKLESLKISKDKAGFEASRAEAMKLYKQKK